MLQKNEKGDNLYYFNVYTGLSKMFISIKELSIAKLFIKRAINNILNIKNYDKKEIMFAYMD